MPTLIYNACVFYGVTLECYEIIDLMKRYERFQPEEWERKDENFDEDKWYADYPLHDALSDLDEELSKELPDVEVSISCFDPTYGEVTYFLAIPETIVHLDEGNPSDILELGDKTEWDSRLKKVHEKLGVGSSSGSYHFLKSEDHRFGVLNFFGLSLKYEELLAILNAHREHFTEKEREVLDYGYIGFDDDGELVDKMEEVWSKAGNPLKIVIIRQMDYEDEYYLTVRNTYLRSENRNDWKLLLKEICDESGVMWHEGSYYVILDLPY